ncbi:MAG: ABC transporter permease subunit [Candidatus Krumholzibacteria bacterium]|nr:ABC transporter permease subunit [Candidatus Krumholzibacteria bacterium]
MTKISSIAVNTFRESIREKLLYIAILFGGILLASTYVLSPLAVGAKQKITMDVGLGAISILGVLTAILVGSTLVHKEVDKKAVFMVLTRPVSRLEYLLGKFSGVVFAIALTIAVMTGVMVLMLIVGKVELRPVFFAAIYLSLLEMMVMCAVVIFFSTFTTPILTSLFSLCFFITGSLSNDLRIFAQKFGGAFMKYMMGILYLILPNLKVFNLRHEAVHDLNFGWTDLSLATLYAAVYCGVALYFAHLVFRRREFS